ncbi:MAG: hypothetical protein M2R45_03015 [Verrucomicrobia subdivision 3 bacterium]|nr:hypothetical protein [Limisphaerales bacterium]MCS1416499.1 hypothetical protein [Limisphaerales bacterium]
MQTPINRQNTQLTMLLIPSDAGMADSPTPKVRINPSLAATFRQSPFSHDHAIKEHPNWENTSPGTRLADAEKITISP